MSEQRQPGPPTPDAPPRGAGRPRRARALLIMLIALAHGLIYAVGVPRWQTPDEPMLFEYAGLMAELGRIPQRADRSPALEARLLDSLLRAHFFRYTVGRDLDPAPASFDAALAAFPMPHQVGGDPPIYFALAAAALRLTPGWGVDEQLTMLRLLNALLLPLVAGATYMAGRAIVGAGGSLAPEAAAALVALQPMATYVGAGMSNDGPATALGALLCLLLVRMIGRGLPGRDLALFVGLALAALAVKRSALPYLLLAAPLGALWLARALLRPAPGAAGRRALALGLALGLPLLAAAWIAGQLAWGQAAGWYDGRSFTPMPRVAAAGGYALPLAAGAEALQVLPAAATAQLRNNVLRAGAHIWSDGPAAGRLVIAAGDRRQELAFELDGEARPQIGAAVPAYATSVRLSIVADRGRILVADVWARGVGLDGNLVANPAMALPPAREGSPLRPALRYLRVEELVWLLQAGPRAWYTPLDGWLSLLFASFWGHFGWFDIPFVHGSPWAWAIGAMCAAGAAGSVVAAARAPAPRRAQLVALLALAALAVVPTLLNALVELLSVQQGRYLFPALPAAALLIACGHEALLPARARPLWLLAWLGFWLALAAAALIRLAQHYSS